MFIIAKYGHEEMHAYLNPNCTCAILLESLKIKSIQEIQQSIKKKSQETKLQVSQLQRQLVALNHQVSDPKLDQSTQSYIDLKKTITNNENRLSRRQELLGQLQEQLQLINKVDTVDLCEVEGSGDINLRDTPSALATNFIVLKKTYKVNGYPAKIERSPDDIPPPIVPTNEKKGAPPPPVDPAEAPFSLSFSLIDPDIDMLDEEDKINNPNKGKKK
eukprot:GHVR01094856.1.p1 GENE.GHVR01094856.1~~GHVR01094856.1.p1  ORF type:complete len:217 (+),score=61.52 GHVR01094856.1:23-673(+)